MIKYQVELKYEKSSSYKFENIKYKKVILKRSDHVFKSSNFMRVISQNLKTR